ncbi:hypothetical protein EXW59_04680 (plasmid) [Bacillus mycoides]|uniref:hypothetical protein n=1 Tax=Bacillus mycoides TaxID=1405 RepID=UPI001C033AF8|nr:hypothetical protein [Bacillus mycoides]QWH76093.1 hypothetical protein EXW59_04680 [Bacillus mycoides]QWI47097.1 hypothetical protein EXW55_29930 [Bacillus mycoides]
MYINRQGCWEQFWEKKIMVGDEVDIEQVKQELFHYKKLRDQKNESENSVKRARILSESLHARFRTKTRKINKKAI